VCAQNVGDTSARRRLTNDRGSYRVYMRSDEHRSSHDRIDPDLIVDLSLRRLPSPEG